MKNDDFIWHSDDYFPKNLSPDSGATQSGDFEKVYSKTYNKKIGGICESF